MDVYRIACFFFFKQKTAYEMRISDWSSDVCSSDLPHPHRHRREDARRRDAPPARLYRRRRPVEAQRVGSRHLLDRRGAECHRRSLHLPVGDRREYVGVGPALHRPERRGVAEGDESPHPLLEQYHRTGGRREGKEDVRPCIAWWTAET